MKPILKILKVGLSCTFQDRGRKGLQQYGVSYGGYLDPIAAHHVALRSGNDVLIECTYAGITLQALEECLLIISGIGIEIDGKKKSGFQVIELELKIDQAVKIRSQGAVFYVGSTAEFHVAKTLGSASTHRPAMLGNPPLEADDVLYKKSVKIRQFISSTIKPPLYKSFHIPILPGPEHSLLTPAQKKELEEKKWTISSLSDRMATQFSEQLEEGILYSMISSPVLPGTIQCTPSGKLIVLMVDGQTIGGYPRVGMLAEGDRIILAQKRAGEMITLNFLENE